jgi:hypothetical protein
MAVSTRGGTARRWRPVRHPFTSRKEPTGMDSQLYADFHDSAYNVAISIDRLPGSTAKRNRSADSPVYPRRDS